MTLQSQLDPFNFVVSQLSDLRISAAGTINSEIQHIMKMKTTITSSLFLRIKLYRNK